MYGYERALRRVGLTPIAGVDEAGRGACAGPLVAAAVILKEGSTIPGLADSKLLTEKARERCYQQVVAYESHPLAHEAHDALQRLQAPR